MTDRVCGVDGCERKHRCKGLCGMHYSRLRATGSVGEAEPLRLTDHPDVCTLDGCDRPYRYKGLCEMHYDRVRKTGSVGKSAPRLVKNRPELCSVEGCDRKHQAKGFCDRHYSRLRASGVVGGPDRMVESRGESCSVDGCVKPQNARGLCHMHYDRFRSSGAVGTPEAKPKYTCAVCSHPDIEVIDASLREGAVKRWLAAAFGFSYKAVDHHKHRHLDNEQYSARAAAEAVKILNEARAAVRA